MRALLQRVSGASVSIAGSVKSSIAEGFLILFGVKDTDTEADVEKLAQKISKLRVFSDAAGKMNLDIKQVGGEILLVSQFTLYADTRKGNRPGFSHAAPPELGEALYLLMADALRRSGITVETGEFGADMQVELVNDGPVTILIDSEELMQPRRS